MPAERSQASLLSDCKFTLPSFGTRRHTDRARQGRPRNTSRNSRVPGPFVRGWCPSSSGASVRTMQTLGDAAHPAASWLARQPRRHAAIDANRVVARQRGRFQLMRQSPARL